MYKAIESYNRFLSRTHGTQGSRLEVESYSSQRCWMVSGLGNKAHDSGQGVPFTAEDSEV